MFIDTRFPEDVAYEAVSSTAFSTNVTELNNGYEQRNMNWIMARREFEVTSARQCEARKDEILNLYNNAKGRANSFRFKDWSDYKVQNQEIAIADGVRDSFQLIKNYKIASETHIRNITKPVSGSVVVYMDGNQAIEGVDYSLDYSTGMVLFINIPALAEVITADFEFDNEVRFNNDSLDIKLLDEKSYKISKVKLIEIKAKSA